MGHTAGSLSVGRPSEKDQITGSETAFYIIVVQGNASVYLLK